MPKLQDSFLTVPINIQLHPLDWMEVRMLAAQAEMPVAKLIDQMVYDEIEKLLGNFKRKLNGEKSQDELAVEEWNATTPAQRRAKMATVKGKARK